MIAQPGYHCRYHDHPHFHAPQPPYHVGVHEGAAEEALCGWRRHAVLSPRNQVLDAHGGATRMPAVHQACRALTHERQVLWNQLVPIKWITAGYNC